MENGIDLAVAIAAIVAAGLGFYFGIFRHLLTWGGMAAGFILSPFIVPYLTDLFSISALSQFSYNSIFIGICILAGAIAGRLLSRIVKFVLPSFINLIDRISGAVVAVIAIFLMAWLVLPLLVSAGGTAEQWHKESAIASFLEDKLPNPPIKRIQKVIESARETEELLEEAKELDDSKLDDSKLDEAREQAGLEN